MKMLFDGLLIGGVIDWVVGILLKICMFIDALVYMLVSGVYQIFMALCKMNMLEFNKIFKGLTNRIYVLLGVIMLFVISFNLLKMLVDPNLASDSKMGGGALAKHVFLSIVMLILAPFVFQLMGEAQDAIIDEGIIEKIVMGSSSSLSGADGGPKFSWMLFSAFFRPADGNEWGSSATVSGKVANAYNSIKVDTYDLTVLTNVADDSTISYTPVVSTIAGIVIIFQLFKFAISVGVRSFKFLFLQVMAPVPIIAYMDPGKGTGIFNKYISEVISTYLDLFIKILTLFLAILLASIAAPLAFSGALFTGITLNGFSRMIAQALIVIALFQFADKLPEVIGNIFGVRVQGGGGFTKALAAGAGFLGGAAIGGAGALAGSAMHSDWTLEKNADGSLNGGATAKRFLSNIGKGAVDGIAGAGRGGFGGAKGGYNNGMNLGLAKTMGAAGMGGVASQMMSSERSRAAGGFFQKQLGKIDNATGAQFRAQHRQENFDRQKNQVANMTQQNGKTYNQMAGEQKDALSRASDLNAVKNTVTQEYAKAYGVDAGTASQYFDEHPGEIDDFLKTDGANNNNIQQAFDEFNAKHTESQLSYDGFATTNFSQHEAQNEAQLNQLETDMKPAEKQIKEIDKKQQADADKWQQRQQRIDASQGK